MKSFALVILRAYKRYLSPMMPVACRYVPTCSDYAMEAIERYGVLRGGAYAAGRFLRCNPWGGHGYDPVSTTPCDSHGCTPSGPNQSLPADTRISKQYGRA
ncbi:MAG: membrane protein insertion efficiency factor YidD [Acidobacteriaceae bacterium]